MLAERLHAGHVELRVRVDDPALAVVLEIHREQRGAAVLSVVVQELVAVLAKPERREFVVQIANLRGVQHGPFRVRRRARVPDAPLRRYAHIQPRCAVAVGDPGIDPILHPILCGHLVGDDVEPGDTRARIRGHLDEHVVGVIRQPVDHAILELREWTFDVLLEQHAHIATVRVHADEPREAHVGARGEHVDAADSAEQPGVVRPIAPLDVELFGLPREDRLHLATREVERPCDRRAFRQLLERNHLRAVWRQTQVPYDGRGTERLRERAR